MRPARRFTALAAALIGALALLALPSLAAARDRNHDHIPDRWEKRHHLSLRVNQARRDQDRDHLRNRAEFLAGDNPRNADSDGDGIPDGAENAGKIESFDPGTGELTIEAFGGKAISGLVTEETEIECAHAGSGASASDAGSGDEAEGEDQGDRSEESGAQREEEHGDDNGEGSQEQGDDDQDEAATGEEGECTSADLKPEAVVHEAELKLENGGAIFEKVELAG